MAAVMARTARARRIMVSKRVRVSCLDRFGGDGSRLVPQRVADFGPVWRGKTEHWRAIASMALEAPLRILSEGTRRQARKVGIMSGKFVVKSDSYGECAYLRMFGRGRYGPKFGLVRNPAEATTFSSRLEAGTKAGQAGNVIMREFKAVELDAIPGAATRPHISVRITA
jgi:hypothetical protein